jgi:hypothetical protein
MDLNREPFQLEVEESVEAEVAALDKKAEERMIKKAEARLRTSNTSVAFPELEKRLEVFESFMKKCESRFFAMEKKITEVWDAKFSRWPVIEDQPLEISEQVQPQIGSETLTVQGEGAEAERTSAPHDVPFGSLQSTSKSGSCNGDDDEDDDVEVPKSSSRSGSESDEEGPRFRK